MKINMPVSDKEVLMKQDEILVTQTDLKGKITYANDAFVAISGYSREELIGANHNIVRHPDMPPAAFEDLWQTLKAGKPWTALVKNRTKSGDYYWVEANITPVFSNGVVQEYLSARYAPSREQISQAEQFYKKLNNKTATMQPTGMAALAKRIKEISLRTKSLFVLFGMVSLFAFLGFHLYDSGDYWQLIIATGLAIPILIVNATLLWSFHGILEQSITIMYRLAEGKFRNKIELNRFDQIGDFYRSLYTMQVKLNANLAESKQVAADALRISEALDNVQSGVMVTDPNLNIIYMNKTVTKLFNEAEQGIRRQLPHFDSKKLLGANIDLFHKNPAHQRAMLERLTSTFRSELTIAGLHMSVVVNPVINNNGERIGFVAEWLNRTDEVKVEKEINSIVQGAGLGDFTQRINEQGKQGFFLNLSQSINQLMATSSTGLNEVVRALNAISRGDLTESITNDYHGTFGQLKDDSNATVDALKSLIGEIKVATESINMAAKEIAAGNHDLSQRTEEQAASLEQTAASMDQLTSTVQQNTENAKQADELAQGASQVAGKGVEVVGQVVKTMEAINESSRKITEIISVIDGIAFQTNILALNAAVEAARAGEQGRGFAVVASEVRNLAQRAAAAAGEIKILIFDSEAKVTNGTRLVAQAGDTMKEILTAINSVTSIMSQITAASVEQSAGIAQVNQVVRQMDEVTQQNAALVEQAAASAESLEDQAENLSINVAQFKIEGSDFCPSVKHGSITRKRTTVDTFKGRMTPTGTTKTKDYSSDEWEQF
jgi:methyl-accepting chemotaxis protein